MEHVKEELKSECRSLEAKLNRIDEAIAKEILVARSLVKVNREGALQRIKAKRKLEEERDDVEAELFSRMQELANLENAMLSKRLNQLSEDVSAAGSAMKKEMQGLKDSAEAINMSPPDALVVLGTAIDQLEAKQLELQTKIHEAKEVEDATFDDEDVDLTESVVLQLAPGNNARSHLYSAMMKRNAKLLTTLLLSRKQLETAATPEAIKSAADAIALLRQNEKNKKGSSSKGHAAEAPSSLPSWVIPAVGATVGVGLIAAAAYFIVGKSDTTAEN